MASKIQRTLVRSRRATLQQNTQGRPNHGYAGVGPDTRMQQHLLTPAAEIHVLAVMVAADIGIGD